MKQYASKRTKEWERCSTWEPTKRVTNGNLNRHAERQVQKAVGIINLKDYGSKKGIQNDIRE
jgi:hypothetical protein